MRSQLSVGQRGSERNMGGSATITTPMWWGTHSYNFQLDMKKAFKTATLSQASSYTTNVTV